MKDSVNLGIDNLGFGSDRPVDTGSRIVFRSKSGGERAAAIAGFVREGLERGEYVIAVIAISVKDFLDRLESLDVDTKRALEEGQLQIVDWERFHRETVRGVEEKDGVLVASVDLANVRMALGIAQDTVEDKTVRILVDILDSASSLYFKNELEEHISPLFARLEGHTSMVVITDKPETEDTVAAFAHMFDGILIMDRKQDGTTVSLVSLGPLVRDVQEKKVYIGDVGLVAEKSGLVCTICGAWTAPEDDGCQSCGADFSLNPPEKVLKKMESGSTKDIFLCPGCGAFISNDAVHCDICGLEFEEEEEEEDSGFFLEDMEELEEELESPEPVAPEGGRAEMMFQRFFGVSGEVKKQKQKEDAYDNLYLCPHCGAIVSATTTSCPICSSKIESEQMNTLAFDDDSALLCPHCGAYLHERAEFCPICDMHMGVEGEIFDDDDVFGYDDAYGIGDVDADDIDKDVGGEEAIEEYEEPIASQTLDDDVQEEPDEEEAWDDEIEGVIAVASFENLLSRKGESSLKSEEGLTNGNGLVNGTLLGRKGFTNGKGKTNGTGMVNGRGHTNGTGLVNGRGRTNGLINGNGLTNGRGKTNGLVNGNGLTNGNGLAGGRGLVNGIGRTNGLINGNGLTNGNGLINGNGLPSGQEYIDGFGGRQKYHDLLKSHSQWQYRGAVILLVLVIIMPIFLILVYQPLPLSQVEIDGSFSDWEDVRSFTDIEYDSVVDILEAKFVDEDAMMYAWLKTSADLGQNDLLRLSVLVDTDGDMSTGYNAHGIGADVIVTTSFLDGISDATTFTGFNNSMDNMDWNGFNVSKPTILAFYGGSVEMAIPKAGTPYTDTSRYQIIAVLEDDMGNQDMTPVFSPYEPEALALYQEIGGTGIAYRGEEVVLGTMDMYVPGDAISISSVNCSMLGSALPDSLDTLSLYLDNGDGVYNSVDTLLASSDVTSPNLTLSLQDPLDMEEGNLSSTHLVGMISSTSPPEVTIGAYITDVTGPASLDNNVDVFALQYIESPPNQIEIDGGYEDWRSGVVFVDLPNDIQDGTDSDANLLTYGLALDGRGLFFYIDVEGRILNGEEIPHVIRAPKITPRPSPVPTPPRLPDADRDGIDDANDTFPDDFNNDGVEDYLETDKDGDGIADYDAGGPDTWIENPSTGARYYVGPSTPATTAPVTGEDAIRIFIDIDSDPFTGYDDPALLLGADSMIEITGRGGVVNSAKVYNHDGTDGWNWTFVGDIDPAISVQAMEMYIPSDPTALLNATVAITITSWDGTRDTSDQEAPVPVTSALSRSYAMSANDGSIWMLTNGNDPITRGATGEDVDIPDGFTSLEYTMFTDGDVVTAGEFDTYTSRTTGRSNEILEVRLEPEGEVDEEAVIALGLNPEVLGVSYDQDIVIGTNEIHYFLNNKLDGHWYRMEAQIPGDNYITHILREDGLVINNWYQEGDSVVFYDDPGSKYILYSSGGYQEYFVLGDEPDMLAMYQDWGSQASTPLTVSGPMHSRISFVAYGNVNIYMDEFEDGYDFDSTTFTGADNVFQLEKGEVLTLTELDTTYTPGSTGVGGRDRFFTAGAPVFMVRGAWPDDVGGTSGVVGAGLWEQYPYSAQQLDYTLPIGQNLPTNDGDLTYIVVQAFKDNTIVTIDEPGGGIEWTGTLDMGEVYTYYGADAGTTVSGDQPIQAALMTSGQGYVDARFYTLTPESALGNDYYIPVDSETTSRTSESRLYVYAFTDSTVYFEDKTGVMPQFIPAGTTYTSYIVPEDSAAHLYTNDPSEKFWVLGAFNSNDDTDDWGFQSLDISLLSTEYYVAYSPSPSPDNGEPLWVTPVENGTTIFVDFDADGYPDESYVLNKLDTLQIEDTNDWNNEGTHVYSDKKFALAYGISTQASTSAPGIDWGYTVLPFNERWMDVVLTLNKSADKTVISRGETVTFSLNVSTNNYGVYSMNVTDILADGWEYIPGSANIVFTDGASDITGSAADPVGTSQHLTWVLNYDLGPPNSTVITFSALATEDALYGYNMNYATAEAVDIAGNHFNPVGSVLVYIDPPPTVIKELWLHDNIGQNILNRTDQWNAGGVQQIGPITAGQSTEFLIEPALSDDLLILGNATAYLWMDDQGADVTIRMYEEDDLGTRIPFATQSFTTANAGGYQLYTVDMNTIDQYIMEGHKLVLNITSDTGTFNLQYDDATRPARLDLEVATYIEVRDIWFENAAGNPTTNFVSGDVVNVYANITDPFGNYDILDNTSIQLEWPSGALLPLDMMSLYSAPVGEGYAIFNYTMTLADPSTSSIIYQTGYDDGVTDPANRLGWFDPVTWVANKDAEDGSVYSIGEEDTTVPQWSNLFNEQWQAPDDNDWLGDSGGEGGSSMEYWVVVNAADDGDHRVIDAGGGNYHFEIRDHDQGPNNQYTEARDAGAAYWDPVGSGWTGGYINFTYDYTLDTGESMYLDVYRDGVWTNAYTRTSIQNNEQPGWTAHSYLLQPADLAANQFSWRFTSDGPGNGDRIQFDDITLDISTLPPPNYEMDVLIEIDNIPVLVDHTLEYIYETTVGEDFNLELWNQTSSGWEDIGDLTQEGSLSGLQQTVLSPSDHFVGPTNTVQIRITGFDEVLDTINDTVLFDFIRVSSSIPSMPIQTGLYNMTITGTEGNLVQNSSTSQFYVSAYGVLITPTSPTSNMSAPGTSHPYNMSIENTGTVNDSFAITLTPSPLGWWPTELWIDTDNDGIADTMIATETNGDGVWDWVDPAYDNGTGTPAIQVMPGNLTNVTLVKHIPSNANLGDMEDTTMTVTSQNDTSVYDSITVITVTPPPPSVQKELWLHRDTSPPDELLDRIEPTELVSVSIGLEEDDDGSGDGYDHSHIWKLEPVLADDLLLVDGTHHVSLFTEWISGTPEIRVALFDGPSLLSETTLAIPTVPGISVADFYLSFDHSFVRGDQIRLEVEVVDNGGTSQANVYYDGTAHNSVVELQVLSYIDVQWVRSYDQNNTQSTLFKEGEKVDIRAYVSDPFGTYDISMANATVYYPNGTVVPGMSGLIMGLYQSDPLVPPAWEIYNNTITLPTGIPVGNYTVNITAVEGNGVIDTMEHVFIVTCGVSIGPDNHNGSAIPGVPVFFNHTITNIGGGYDNYDIKLTSTQGWTVRVYHDTDGNGVFNSSIDNWMGTDNNGDGVWDMVNASYDTPGIGGIGPDTGQLPVGASFPIILAVQVPMAAGSNLVEYINVTSTSILGQCDDTAYNTLAVIPFTSVEWIAMISIPLFLFYSGATKRRNGSKRKKSYITDTPDTEIA